jgi:hypothetical protein
LGVGVPDEPFCEIRYDLASLIQEFIGDWEIEGTSIALTAGGMLVVKHTKQIQDHIEKFLGFLR